ncbi:hypothetical protein HAX54_045652 [Datura stramonium]|uniref:Uncharacterized protein n=1 Tax=Datura stramonium TaxID=4076 RepID=A0ABS8RPH5_DATST|nr:hypothetical protein [Datura stramonium]
MADGDMLEKMKTYGRRSLTKSMEHWVIGAPRQEHYGVAYVTPLGLLECLCVYANYLSWNDRKLLSNDNAGQRTFEGQFSSGLHISTCSTDASIKGARALNDNEDVLVWKHKGKKVFKVTGAYALLIMRAITTTWQETGGKAP